MKKNFLFVLPETADNGNRMGWRLVNGLANGVWPVKASLKVGLGTADGVDPLLHTLAVVVLTLETTDTVADDPDDDVNGGLGRMQPDGSALSSPAPHSAAFQDGSVLISVVVGGTWCCCCCWWWWWNDNDGGGMTRCWGCCPRQSASFSSSPALVHIGCGLPGPADWIPSISCSSSSSSSSASSSWMGSVLRAAIIVVWAGSGGGGCWGGLGPTPCVADVSLADGQTFNEGPAGNSWSIWLTSWSDNSPSHDIGRSLSSASVDPALLLRKSIPTWAVKDYRNKI